MSAWLWLFLVALLVLPVLLRFYAEDGPRSDEPPDTSGRERDRAEIRPARLAAS
jgi:hypothetical protein